MVLLVRLEVAHERHLQCARPRGSQCRRRRFLSIMVTIQTPTGKARITAASGVCPKSTWLTAQITVSMTAATAKHRTTKAIAG